MLTGAKVLLIGASGQIGRDVARRFADSCEIWRVADFNGLESGEKAGPREDMPYSINLSAGGLDRLPGDFDYVFHFAEVRDPYSVTEGLEGNCHAVARVMKHCRKAKAFLHLSSAWVYKPDPDSRRAFSESSDIGRNFGGQYAASKIAGEAAARAGSLILGVPTVICRANVVYGPAGGGALDQAIDDFVATSQVRATAGTPACFSPLHEDDVADLIEPSLALAAIPPAIVNWCGDEIVSWHEIFRHIGRVIDREPLESGPLESARPSCAQDPALRRSLAGPTRTSWKDGVAGVLQARHAGVGWRGVA